MPVQDVPLGQSMTITDKVVPNLVGVDIGLWHRSNKVTGKPLI